MLQGVVVFSVLSLALGEIFTVANHDNSSFVTNSSEINPYVQGVCYFGRVPSALCIFKCFMKGSGSYCDEAQCLCKVEDHQVLESNHTAAVEEHNIAIKPHLQTADNEAPSNQTEPIYRRFTIFVFDLKKLFGLPEENATDVTIVPDKTSDAMSKYYGEFQQLWTLPHILAVAILTLLTVLVVMEVLHCCRRRNRKNQFHTILSVPALEKVYVDEKR